MTTAAASQQAVKGLDLGTSRIVLATLNGQDVNFTPQLNAFVDIPFSKMTEQMLGREHILHQVEGAAYLRLRQPGRRIRQIPRWATRAGRCRAACSTRPSPRTWR